MCVCVCVCVCVTALSAQVGCRKGLQRKMNLGHLLKWYGTPIFSSDKYQTP